MFLHRILLDSQMSSVHTQNCLKKKQHQKLQLLVGFFSCFESWKHNILLKSSEIFHLFLRRCERWESLKLSSELKYNIYIYITQILLLIVYIWEQVWSTENPNYTKHDNMKENSWNWRHIKEKILQKACLWVYETLFCQSSHCSDWTLQGDECSL